MMNISSKLTMALIGLTLLSANGAEAAKTKKEAKAQASTAATAAASKKNSRDIRFNGSTVDGKYLTAGETIAEVEGEKEMGNLIGIRKNFRDKLKAEQVKLASGKGQ